MLQFGPGGKFDKQTFEQQTKYSLNETNRQCQDEALSHSPQSSLARYCDSLISAEVKSGLKIKVSRMMKRQGDLIAAEKVITWTVASNCLMMQ